MKYTLINDFQKINLKQWNDFVKDDPRGIIFQTPEMYKVYQNTKKSFQNLGNFLKKT